MTDDKDALEELKRLRSEVQRDADFLRAGRNTAGPQDCYVRDLDAAIAAWEKERAETPLARVMAVERDKWMGKYHILRAEVTRIAGEIRHWLPMLKELEADAMLRDPWHTAIERIEEQADALDAALRGADA